MKVLHLTTHLDPGGITVYILRLIRLFAQQGIQTFVISSGGSYAPLLKAEGAQVSDFPIRTKSELHPKIYMALPRILRFIRENQIDVIHAHTRVTQVMAFWIQRCIDIPVVTTCHGFYRRRLGRMLNPAWGDRVIAISEPVGETLAKMHHVPSAQIRTVPNGIDFAEIDAAYRRHETGTAKVSFGFGREDPVIGIVARLVEDKGHAFLLRALVKLKDRFPAMRLLIVGEGKYRKTLEGMIAAKQLQDDVVLTGNLVDVTRALAAMDVFVFPAIWKEGFGLSLIEAMACHKPVVAARIWALDSLIEHEKTGLLVEPRQVAPLVQGVTRFLEDTDFRNAICREARAMAEQHFSIERMARKIAEVYHRVQSDRLTGKDSGL